MLLDKDLDVRETLSILGGLRDAGDPEMVGVVDAFLHQHAAELMDRLPKPAHTILLSPSRGFCDERGLATYQAEWGELAARMLNGKRTLETHVADIRSCIALRSAQQASVARFLGAK